MSAEEIKIKIFRKMEKLKKPLLFFLIFSLIISVFINYRYYELRREEEKRFTFFLDDFYSEIYRAISGVETLIQEEPANGELDSSLAVLRSQLYLLNHMLTRISYYMGGDWGGSNDIRETATIINSGIDFNGHYIPPFRKDNELNKNEIAFLKAFKVYLENIRDSLRSEEAVYYVNKNIGKDEFGRIISGDLIRLNYPSFINEYIEQDNK